MLQALAARAAERINRCFAHFNDQTRIISSQISADDLLLKFGVHSRAFEIANTITECLVRFSSIAARGTTEGVARACQRLSKNGVLDYRADAGQGGNYVVTPAYRSALGELQERRTLNLQKSAISAETPRLRG
jgi:hypothetical protein